MPRYYDLPWGPGVVGTVFDSTDDSFGPIMAAIQGGEFITAARLLVELECKSSGPEPVIGLLRETRDGLRELDEIGK